MKQEKFAIKAFTQLDVSNIKNIAQGACFLASGGGGSLQLALTKIIPAFFNSQTTLKLVDIQDLSQKDKMWGAVVACMGSPLKLFEDPKLVSTSILALKRLGDLCCAFKVTDPKRFETFQGMNFCLPIEIGAVNSLVAMIVAQGTKPLMVLVDADGAGRAVPTLPLTTYARKIDLYPNILGGKNLVAPHTDNSFDYGSINVENETVLEAVFLGMINSKAFGDASGLAIYAANGPTFQKSNPVTGGISNSLQIGEIINTSTQGKRLNETLAYITNQYMKPIAKQIFYGHVTDMKEATSSLDRGYVIITGDKCLFTSNDFTGQSFKLFILNENIWGQLTRNGIAQPWIVGPDSMCYLTDENDVFDNSDLWNLFKSKGQPTVSIVGIQAPSEVRQNNELMTAWGQTVKTQCGPNTYITPWIDDKNL